MVLCLKARKSRSLPGFKSLLTKLIKNIIVVTGGAGFIGSNLIENLVKQFNYKIISIDNYLSEKSKNHIKNSKITNLKGNTKYITKILKKL